MKNLLIVGAGPMGRLTFAYAKDVGIANLRRLDEILADRRAKYARYRGLLSQSVNTYRAIVPEAAPCPVSESLAERILCLPLYSTPPEDSVRAIAEIILDAVKEVI